MFFCIIIIIIIIISSLRNVALSLGLMYEVLMTHVKVCHPAANFSILAECVEPTLQKLFSLNN
jgi:hypothetical protein